MLDIYKQQILQLISHKDYKPIKISLIQDALNIPASEVTEFKQAINDLKKNGKITVGIRSVVSLPQISGRVTGRFQMTRRGFGFVIPTDEKTDGDLFIPPESIKDAMNGDTVIAQVVRKSVRDGKMRYTGAVLEIVERKQSIYTGTLKLVKKKWVVTPDGRDFTSEVLVDDVGAKGGRDGDKVAFEISEYPTGNYPARGVITQILGRAGKYDAELLAVITANGLPQGYPERCLEQAREVAHHYSPDSDPNRDDITDEMIITIDPEDARDFDDAISLKRTSHGGWILGVHIADVSTFIPMDSKLDLEAKERGNSIYLPGKVIPMLPEILSNGICSLQPDQKRFAKTVYITYDSDGNVTGREFANSLILSKCRLTYEQANDIIGGKAEGYDGAVVALLMDMETLAQVIEERRKKQGMIHLDLPETQLIYDNEGNVVDAEPVDTSYPHTIIEMFMVEANEAVASLLDRFNVPFIRRIHPDPDTFGMKTLQKFVKICGMKVPRKMDRFAIQHLLSVVKDTKFEFPINNYVLRTFEKARYSPLNIGHFALSSRHYCHFTSPIRRYADLTVHRLLQVYLEGRLNKIGLEEVLPELTLNEISKNISFTEDRAAKSERDLRKLLLLQMLSKRIGDEMDTFVSGLTNSCVFVQCKKFGIEGLIELPELGSDEWRYNEKSQAIVGRHSGKAIRLGDSMKVRIVSVNPPARTLSLAPVKAIVEKRKLKSMNKSSRKPKANSSKKKQKNRSR